MTRKYTYQALIKKDDPVDESDYPLAFLIVVPAEDEVQARNYAEKICLHEYKLDLIAIKENTNI